MDSQSVDQQKGRGKNKHVWTTSQDEKLVEALLELCVSGTMKCENGFKPGTFAQIEKLLEEKLPGSGIKANLHIESRVKTLKKQYHAISEMVMDGSGFAWDEDKKMIICEKDIYDKWVKSHPNAQGMWLKPFPHFESMGYVFGKDRATGKQAASATDFVQELDQDDTNNNESLDDILEETNQPPISQSPITAAEGSTQSNGRRRKRTDAYVLGLTQMVSAMTKTAEAMDKLVGSFAETDPMLKVYEEVSKISGLSSSSTLKASQIIMADLVKINLLFSIPADVKKEWVEELIK